MKGEWHTEPLVIFPFKTAQPDGTNFGSDWEEEVNIVIKILNFVLNLCLVLIGSRLGGQNS